MPTKRKPSQATRKPSQATNGNKSPDKSQKPDQISEINEKIERAIKEFSKARDNARILPLFLKGAEINTKTVDDVYDELRQKFKGTSNHDRLDVILESSGGSIDPAYNIGLLLRRYAKKELNIIIPRWAKSAATVLACAGDKILMTPVAEIGPVDPQITMFNALEGRLEEFSPLSIDATLDLIRQEFKEGHEKLAQGLLERLQFPLTLGSIKKSLEVGTHYIERLLCSRMLRNDAEKAKEIANGLVHDYSNHGFCIEVDEACKLGLKAELLPDSQIEILWELRKLLQERTRIEQQKKRKEVEKMLENLPPEILKQLPLDLLGKDGKKDSEATPIVDTPSKREGA